jgi:hypothetical protein
LTKVVEKILVEDNGESLRKRIAELEAENSQLTTAIVESSKTISKLRHSFDNGVEDYNLLMAGNESMLAERNDLHHHAEDLESELAKVRTAAATDVTVLETKIESAKVDRVDVVASSEKRLKDFEDELVVNLVGLHTLYICNINRIRGMHSSMLEGEPSTMDYIRWLSTEVTGLPKMFAGINENFISVAIDGTLMIAGDSVDLAALQTVTIDSEADILHMGRDVQKVARAVSKKWWRSFGYDFVLAAIRAKLSEVIDHAQLILL